MSRLVGWACALDHPVMCGWSWVDQCLWNPDRCGVVSELNWWAFEVFDADPCTDQAIEHALHRLERSPHHHLGWSGDDAGDAVDVFIETDFDCLVLLEQPFNSLAARKLPSFPVLA